MTWPKSLPAISARSAAGLTTLVGPLAWSKAKSSRAVTAVAGPIAATSTALRRVVPATTPCPRCEIRALMRDPAGFHLCRPLGPVRLELTADSSAVTARVFPLLLVTLSHTLGTCFVQLGGVRK